MVPATWLFEVPSPNDYPPPGDVGEDCRPFPPTTTAFRFSDRPQFIARDSDNRLLYSTRGVRSEDPADTGPLVQRGSLHTVDFEPGWDFPQQRILVRLEDIDPLGFVQDTITLPGDTVLVRADGFLSIAHIDSIVGYRVRFEDGVCRPYAQYFDHRPGFPDQIIKSDSTSSVVAGLEQLEQRGSDVFWDVGVWKVGDVSFGDTTYLAASGDRRWIAVGEGGEPTNRRITFWDAELGSIQQRLVVADLVGDAGETVFGVDLNFDGTLGAARGDASTYFFTRDHRLQGVTAHDPLDAWSGAGIQVHWNHPEYTQGLPSSELSLSFVGTGANTLRILDTVHFSERAQLHIRDNVVGPLKVSPPFRSDNNGAGRNCSAQDCVVAKLFGVTDKGTLVVIDVTRAYLGSVL